MNHQELRDLKPDSPPIAVFTILKSKFYALSDQVQRLASPSSLANSISLNSSPIVDVRKFDGSHEKWNAWKNNFQSVVHNHTEISNYVKHSQLSNAVQWLAAQEIEEFEISDENYSLAWDVLCKAYDQKRLVVNEHLNKIFTLPKVAEAKYKPLPSLMYTMRQHLKVLETLDIRIPDAASVCLLERSLTSADTLEDILSIREEMIQLLNRGGFVIRKWSSNHPSALENIAKKIFDLDCGIQSSPIKKTLGVVWDSQLDFFSYSVDPEDPVSTSTKRKLLSQIAKVFDPLGLLGSLMLYAKTLVQECWRANITWDESLPQNIHTKWISLAEELPSLKGFAMPRLVCTKSMVASLNHNTIPRLELAGAALLKKIYVGSRDQLDFPIERVIFWSDSMIVICWLKKAPHLLKIYEANRVKDIQELDGEVQWRHVRSGDNPADALSRGQLPHDLLKNLL
ncbi:hypothetical protein TSAR_006655 [Trichomalopsis sarcophagae]|uniref:Uncharacterized protein n=1 Tax=Trichomalopsis sarcophagae TaxID=543379 RepID=A0A232EH57_9HYME|nr:hypothetical protein TSAR_006655 [Trichomalopsis sarcophagae]